MRRLKIRSLHSVSQQGFTIVELMIATTVFSVIMVVITVGVISFTNSYYRGINTSNTQQTAQNIVDSIGQAIQYSGSAPSTVQTNHTMNYFCAGGNAYRFKMGEEYLGTPSRTIGLFVAPNTATGSCVPPNVGNPKGKELLSNRMRIANLAISGPAHVWSNPSDPTTETDLYTVTLQLAYGDADLLCQTGIPAGNAGSCASANYFPSNALVSGSANDVQCRTQIGSQFCAVSTLVSTVQQRIK